MSMDVMTNVVFPIFNLTVLVAGVIGLCGAIIFISGGSTLEKVNTLFNKKIFAIGPSVKKIDEDVVQIDIWVMKRPKLVGVIMLIVALVLILNPYTHIR